MRNVNRGIERLSPSSRARIPSKGGFKATHGTRLSVPATHAGIFLSQALRGCD
jgi:hypothetical protein